MRPRWRTQTIAPGDEGDVADASAAGIVGRESGIVLVDLNRAGVGLLELVTEPDLRRCARCGHRSCEPISQCGYAMRSGKEAASFVRRLRFMLRRVGVCDGDMTAGSMRVDVNVSVRQAREVDGRT